MSESGNPVVEGLRPLTLGETFDRAITIAVKNIRPLTLIGLAFVIPFAVLQYLVAGNSAGGYQQLLDEISHPGRVVAPPADFGSMFGWLMLLFAFSFFGTQFVSVAYAAAVSSVYRGATPQWTDCYAAGFRRAGSVVLCAVVFVFVMAGAVLAGSFGFGFLTVLAALSARGALAVAVVFFIVLAAYFIVWMFAMGLVYLAQVFMLYGVVIEGMPLEVAFGSGFRRVFGKGEIGRALLVCLSLAAVFVAEMIVSSGFGFLLETAVRIRVLEIAVTALISLVFLVFFRTLLAVYYFDVRVRREGLDLERQIDALDSAASA